MSLTQFDAVVTCLPGVVTTVAAARVGRVAGAFQNQDKIGNLIARLGADPSEGVGLIIRPGDSTAFANGTPGQGNSTNFYEGDVRVFNPHNSHIRVFVIEATVT